jgi:hypothetical protein
MNRLQPQKNQGQLRIPGLDLGSSAALVLNGLRDILKADEGRRMDLDAIQVVAIPLGDGKYTIAAARPEDFSSPEVAGIARRGIAFAIIGQNERLLVAYDPDRASFTADTTTSAK